MGRSPKYRGSVTWSFRIPPNLDKALAKSAKERGISKNDLAMEILASWERGMPPGELAGDIIRKAVARVVLYSLRPQLERVLDESSPPEPVGRVQPSEGVSGGGVSGWDEYEAAVNKVRAKARADGNTQLLALLG